MEDIIIIPINDETDFNIIQDELFKHGYRYPYGTSKTNYNSILKCFILLINKKNMYFSTHNINVTKKKYNKTDFNILDINNIKELYSYFNKLKLVNYNEPRKLVYENKIIKYNEFKNVL